MQFLLYFHAWNSKNVTYEGLFVACQDTWNDVEKVSMFNTLFEHKISTYCCSQILTVKKLFHRHEVQFVEVKTFFLQKLYQNIIDMLFWQMYSILNKFLPKIQYLSKNVPYPKIEMQFIFWFSISELFSNRYSIKASENCNKG